MPLALASRALQPMSTAPHDRAILILWQIDTRFKTPWSGEVLSRRGFCHLGWVWMSCTHMDADLYCEDFEAAGWREPDGEADALGRKAVAA